MSKMHSTERNRRTQQTEGPTLTQQHFKEKADINYIVNHALQTRTEPRTDFGRLGSRPLKPIYGDFSAVDHLDWRNKIADAEMAFHRLGPRIRAKFRNDPYQMLRWVEDPENREEAIKLGLLVVQNETYEEAALKAEAEARGEAPKADPEANPGFEKKPTK